MGFGGKCTRACLLVLGLIALIQPARAEITEANTENTSLDSEGNRELNCLARGIYFEARGESIRGQLAVGRVILNRVKSEAYPNTVCGVVYQNKNRHNRCQFSFACDGKPDTIKERAEWGVIQVHAAWLLASNIDDRTTRLVRYATHYHADYVSPHWSRVLVLAGRIGHHLFYYDPSA
jgi:spore germination cell wall hydrolase CwlJ-like protein